MKKSVLVLILFGALLASCSTYTCATYAKQPKKQEQRDARI